MGDAASPQSEEHPFLSSWKPPSLAVQEFLRVVVLQDGDHTGRSVIWDSNRVFGKFCNDDQVRKSVYNALV